MKNKILLCIICLCVFMPNSAFSWPYPIHIAAEKGDVLQLKEMLKEENVDIDIMGQSDGQGENRSPLMIAAEFGHAEAVRLLLAHNASVTIKDYNTRLVPLCYAAQNGNPEIVKLFIDKGAANNNDNYYELSPLMYAAKEGHLEAARLIINYDAKDSPNIDALDKDGNTVLMHAVRGGNAEIVSLILDKKPQVNFAEKTFARTALMLAAEGGYAVMMQLLIQKDADPYHRDIYNNTILINASNNNHVDAMKVALANKVDVNAQNTLGSTALHRAALHGNTEAVKLLLEHNANVVLKDKKGRTPLMLATQKKHKNIVALLKEAEKDRGDEIKIE